MAELDNLINTSIDKTLKPYSNSKYDTFIRNLPSGVTVGSDIPQGVSVPPNSNFTKVPSSDQFYIYIKKTLLDSVWNTQFPLTINIPLYVFRYLFNFSYILAFIGAIFYSVISLLNIDSSVILLNRNSSFIFNIIIGISGLFAMILWIYTKMIQSYIDATLQSLLI